MIPFATCLRLNRTGRSGQADGVEWTVQVQIADEAQADQGRRDCSLQSEAIASSSGIHIQVDAIAATVGSPGDNGSLEGDSGTLLSSKEDTDDGSLTLSTRIVGGRRRSSTSIRFADDTDTGTDILVITEETLDDILSDPIYGDLTLPRRRRSSVRMVSTQLTPLDEPPVGLGVGLSAARRFVKRMSLVPPFHHRQFLLGLQGMSLSGTGPLGPVSPNDQDKVTQRRILLTLRRRKSLNKSVHVDPIALLDYGYFKITDRFLMNSANWRFNTFTLDTMTNGHSLSQLLFYLFTKYGLIDHFQLDILSVWKCFRLFEQGYHDTNPYHNSIHAADVTQAMHCFIQEDSIGRHLSPMETMCAILAAVGHDLDHPGVSQSFLIATNSHLASLYNNQSVLESHHWRFCISCLHESHIFDHFRADQWAEVKHLVKSLIMATDITQQASYLARFRAVLATREPLSMSLASNRLFVMQLALKCADLANPCRPWVLSKRWSEQICSEFYRQGDFERQLDIPVTPMCNRYKSFMAKIQTDFFKNVVTPLFELWDQFLSSPLSRQLIANLRFNNNQWESFLDPKFVSRRHSFNCQLSASTNQSRRSSGTSSTRSSLSSTSSTGLRRSASMDDISILKGTSMTPLPTLAQLKEWKFSRPTSLSSVITTATIINTARRSSSGSRLHRTVGEHRHQVPQGLRLHASRKSQCDGIHGCGTPSTISPIAESPTTPLSPKSSSDSTGDKQPIFIHLEFGTRSHSNLALAHKRSQGAAQYCGGRRGSAPGCIGVYTSCELAAALVFLQGAIKSSHQPRRSSAPVDVARNRPSYATST
ncbi:cAMP-specific 3',5'-cyclic phosphodiesterase 7B [Halotydeus destructor]|nr:cAMP-specific 3',5'-cyclic phosphodiesterase 7B [Halotydeus destructor]